MGKLQEFQMKMSWNEDMFMCTDVPVDIFHYTSPSGFESILFNNTKQIELWASRHDCLNDTSEGTVAQTRYKVVCENMLQDGELDSSTYDLLINVQPPRTTLMWHRKGADSILTRPEYTRYVCSFSKNPDSLAMWNYYSKGSKYEGFNLGFYAQPMLESIETQLHPFESKVRLYPVVYEQSEQEQLIKDFIRKLIEHYEPGDEDILRYMASNQLLQWSLVFKHDFFKHEEEVRLIVDVGIKKFASQDGIPQIDVSYRISNGYTIPYIKLQFEKHCLSYATIGPLMCDAVSKETQLAVICERLSANNYTAIEQCSRIPVRRKILCKRFSTKSRICPGTGRFRQGSPWRPKTPGSLNRYARPPA